MEIRSKRQNGYTLFMDLSKAFTLNTLTERKKLDTLNHNLSLAKLNAFLSMQKDLAERFQSANLKNNFCE